MLLEPWNCFGRKFIQASPILRITETVKQFVYEDPACYCNNKSGLVKGYFITVKIMCGDGEWVWGLA